MGNTIKITGISRGEIYSPNHTNNDGMIFQKTADELRNLGAIIEIMDEKKFLNSEVNGNIFFSMVRNPASVEKLIRMGENGALVINSGTAINNCYRANITRILLEHNISYPKSIIVKTNDVVWEEMNVFENYPYNDGSVNNNVIWPKFIADVRASDTDFVGVVVQASFLSQQFKGMAKKVKQDLIALGCYKIVINEYSDFDETKAKVKTCIVFCRKGYVGRVTYVERSTGRTVQKSLELPFDMIFDTNHIQFLDALDQSRTLSFARFPQYGKWCKDTPENKKLWAIGSYYKTEGFDKNPLKQFVKIAPLSGAERNYYCVFGSAKTEAEIDRVLEQVKSFWFNDAVQSALLLTRYQISLDKTQYAKIPKTIIDHIFSEDELFKIWGIPENAKQAAKELVKNCDYKKKVAIEESNAENN
jgi:hypothetical protein